MGRHGGETPESFRDVLSVVVTEVARKLGQQDSMPDITLAMATGIMKGPFYKSDLDDPSTGTGWFSNFLLYGDGEAPAEFTKKQIQWSAEGESSGVVLSPDDATALQKFKTFLPATHEASHNVHRMLLIAKAIFPPKHAFLRHLSELESQWQNHYQTIKNCVLSNSTMDNSKGTSLKPSPSLLRSTSTGSNLTQVQQMLRLNHR